MGLPDWAAQGRGCKCVDDEWTDVFNTDSPGPFPRKGQRFIIGGTHELNEMGYLILADRGVAQDFYAVTGFAPLTPEEMDCFMIERSIKDVSVRSSRELETA